MKQARFEGKWARFAHTKLRVRERPQDDSGRSALSRSSTWGAAAAAEQSGTGATPLPPAQGAEGGASGGGDGGRQNQGSDGVTNPQGRRGSTGTPVGGSQDTSGVSMAKDPTSGISDEPNDLRRITRSTEKIMGGQGKV